MSLWIPIRWWITIAIKLTMLHESRAQFIKLMTLCVSADDCFELGRVAYNGGDHYHAILWMTESLERLNSEVNETTDRGILLDYLAYSLYVVSVLDRNFMW